jgi:hypothetical protein
VLEPPVVPVDARGWPLDFWDLFGALPERLDLGERDRSPERGPWVDEEWASPIFSIRTR